MLASKVITKQQILELLQLPEDKTVSDGCMRCPICSTSIIGGLAFDDYLLEAITDIKLYEKALKCYPVANKVQPQDSDDDSDSDDDEVSERRESVGGGSQWEEGFSGSSEVLVLLSSCWKFGSPRVVVLLLEVRKSSCCCPIVGSSEVLVLLSYCFMWCLLL